MSTASTTQAELPIYRREFDAFDGKSLEGQVRELADREEIRELIARYAHLIAHSYSVADLFTDDGVYLQAMPGMPVKETHGRAAIAQLYASWVPETPTSPKPMIHNYLIEISGDEASGMCSNEVRMTRDGQSLIGSAFYEDRFRREKGRWKFSYRNSTFFHVVPIQKGWAEPSDGQ